MDDRLLKPDEVGAFFGVNRRTVNTWAAAGRLPRVLTPGGQIRYRETDVRALLEGSASPPGSPLSDENDQEAETVGGNTKAVSGHVPVFP